ncbi:hypothetical protein [Methanobrevibacter sp.]|uniref:phage tail protein n=1 Tax=Methanobrevibacter sp. TaxID=66852 RepID=UPI00386BB997
MVSREMIEIILKAEDQASKVVKDNETAIKKFGDAAKQANDKAKQSSQMTQQQLSNLSKEIKNVSTSSKSVGDKGANQFRRYNKSIQDSIVKFNMLDKETQEWLNRLSNSHNPKVFYELNSKCQEAVAKFKALDNATNTWKGSLDYSRTKLQLLGTNTDSLKGKLQVVGNSITTYLGSKWDIIKTKVSSVGSFIKTNLSSALSTVRSKVDSLGSAFSGLGGLISSAIGGLGMASISEMTVGLAMNRERMTALTSATMGSAEAGRDFVGVMDDLTNTSLVSLDDLGQAMSTIKMSTGMTNTQLQSFTTTVNDVGQRAILMGRSGEEAISLMQSAGRGLNGEFDMLKSNFGITKDKLESLGWSGAADDVEGYQSALEKALQEGGDMNGMMDTSVGHLETLKKNFRVAGRHVGEKFTPMIDGAVQKLNEMNDSCPGLFEGLVEVAGGVSMFATAAPTISPMLSAFDNLHDKGKKVMKFFRESKVISTFFTTLAGGEGILAAITAGYDAMAISEYIALGPLLAIIAAIAVLGVAIYEVGKYFGWWDDVGSMLQAIWAGIQRVWEAFINHPDVQGFLQALGEAWNWVASGISWVWESLLGFFGVATGGDFDIITALINGIGTAWRLITTPIKAVIAVFGDVITNIQGVLGGTISVQDAIMNIWESIKTNIGPIAMAIMEIVSQLATQLWSYASQAGMNFFNGIYSYVSRIPGMIWNYIMGILNNTGLQMSRWIQIGKNRALRFLLAIVTTISSLPMRIATYLYNVVSRIISAGSQWVSSGVNAAISMVNGIINNVSQLPGKVYTEFMNIGSRIMQAGSDLVNKAIDIGKNIVDGLLGAMGIHSPGIIQESVVGEVVDMIGSVGSKTKEAFKTASQLGTAIVDGFGNPELETRMENIMPNPDAVKTEAGLNAEMQHSVDTPQVDTTPITESNNTVVTSFKDLATKTGDALKKMVDTDKKTYDTIKNNDTAQLNIIRSNLQTNMNAMTNKFRNSMNTMVAKNKSGMNTVKNTTKVQLDNMVTKTKSANQKMIQSWGHMKDGIVSAADKIKTDSTNHFNKLENTIGSFYRKLQNPGGFGAGPGNGMVSTTKPLRRSGSSGLRIITNAMRKAQLPSFMTLSQLRNNPLVNMNGIGSYITANGKGNKFSVSDLIRSGTIRVPFGLVDKGNKGAGDWTSGVPNHVSHIKNKSGEWGMKGPKIIGKYATSVGFKVKEFMNGVPDIDFGTFKQIAEDVFSQCHYEFYYDSNKYGNWMTAFRHGGMNCSDSSDALIAMAHACGLPAYKVHGHWNQFGHYWANVAGHKMDTTGWMNRRTWTPSASHAGPAPKGVGFDDIINAIIDLFNDDPENTPGAGGLETTSDTMTVNGEMKIKHEFVNLPENISAEEVARLINDVPDDEGWIKKLVKNVVFQKWDAKEKGRLEAKQNRARGV